MLDSGACTRTALIAVTSLVVVLAMVGPSAGEVPSPPCLGLDSVQMMDAPGNIAAFDIGGDYAATLDNTGLTVWTFRADGYPIRRGSWVAPRGFEAWVSSTLPLEVDPRGWAYVGSYGQGLFVFDIRNPDEPAIVYQSIPRLDRDLEFAFGPTLLGGKLFLRSERSPGYVFVDIGRPQNPRTVSSELPPTDWLVPYIGFVDRHLVASPIRGGAGREIEVWDLADFGEPKLISTISDTTGFNPGVLWASDATAILASGAGGGVSTFRPLGVLDLSDPVNPGYVEIHELEEPYSRWNSIASVAFDGSSAFVAASTFREDYSQQPVLDWLDLRDPLSPVVLERFEIPSNDPIKALGVRTGLLYAVAYGGGMRVYDITAGLEEIWRIPSHGFTWGVAFHRGRAVMLHGHRGLTTYDVDASNRLTLTGHLDFEHEIFDIGISGDLAAVQGWTDELHGVVYLVDLSDPDDPSLEGEVLYGQPLSDFALEDDTLLVTEAAVVRDPTYHEWAVFDVSDPSEPSQVAEVDAVGTCYSVDMRNGLAALRSIGSTEIFDLSIPSAPVKLSSVSSGGDTRTSVALTDELMVVGSAFSTRAWDIIDPENPIEVPEVRDLRVGLPRVRSFGNQVVGTSSTRTWLFDLDDPHQPSARGVAVLRTSMLPAVVGDQVWVPSPPFIEMLSTDCVAPEAAFYLHQGWREVWLHSSTSGVVDTLIWDFGDGSTEVQDLRFWDPDEYRHHEAHHRYAIPGSYTIELTAVGPYGTSTSSRVIEVVTPDEFRTPRETSGRRTP